MAEGKSVGPAEIALLALVDRDLRERLIANLREVFIGMDTKADDYVLAGPGEGE